MTARKKTSSKTVPKALPGATKRKLSLLELSEELGNVSKACRVMGYHGPTSQEDPIDEPKAA